MRIRRLILNAASIAFLLMAAGVIAAQMRSYGWPLTAAWQMLHTDGLERHIVQILDGRLTLVSYRAVYYLHGHQEPERVYGNDENSMLKLDSGFSTNAVIPDPATRLPIDEMLTADRWTLSTPISLQRGPGTSISNGWFLRCPSWWAVIVLLVVPTIRITLAFKRGVQSPQMAVQVYDLLTLDSVMMLAPLLILTLRSLFIGQLISISNSRPSAHPGQSWRDDTSVVGMIAISHGYLTGSSPDPSRPKRPWQHQRRRSNGVPAI
jgi:hypothetical protein